MLDKEVKEIQDKAMEFVERSTSKGVKTQQKKPNKYADEWIKLFLDSLNLISANDHDFRDAYTF